ncbi:hypothetical protein ACH4HG_24580 [Streptomyces coeruleorubidus]|uniref:hypothetical protein n=1 Tax=Streptomyces coeruleorubidus TaxID=116188 RepID=UPI0037B06B19
MTEPPVVHPGDIQVSHAPGYTIAEGSHEQWARDHGSRRTRYAGCGASRAVVPACPAARTAPPTPDQSHSFVAHRMPERRVEHQP